VGFRTAEVVTDPLPAAAADLLGSDRAGAAAGDDAGTVFYLRINGVPVYAKGANLIPANVLPTNVTGAALRRLLDAALAANMNTVRPFSLGPARRGWPRAEVWLAWRLLAGRKPTLLFSLNSAERLGWKRQVQKKHQKVRVWGGGVYPRDELYDYADQVGLMIWCARLTGVDRRLTAL
jgi:beta-galactosidase/beta-glucuronidase